MPNSLAVFALNSSRGFGENVCAHLGIYRYDHPEQ